MSFRPVINYCGKKAAFISNTVALCINPTTCGSFIVGGILTGRGDTNRYISLPVGAGSRPASSSSFVRYPSVSRSFYFFFTRSTELWKGGIEPLLLCVCTPTCAMMYDFLCKFRPWRTPAVTKLFFFSFFLTHHRQFGNFLEMLHNWEAF